MLQGRLASVVLTAGVRGSFWMAQSGCTRRHSLKGTSCTAEHEGQLIDSAEVGCGWRGAINPAICQLSAPQMAIACHTSIRGSTAHNAPDIQTVYCHLRSKSRCCSHPYHFLNAELITAGDLSLARSGVKQNKRAMLGSKTGKQEQASEHNNFMSLPRDVWSVVLTKAAAPLRELRNDEGRSHVARWLDLALVCKQ